MPLVFDPLQAICGALPESVEIVGMYPVAVSSTTVTLAQFEELASWACVGYATKVFVYRTRFRVDWSPVVEADTQTTWRYPPESIAMEGSALSKV